MENQFVVTRFIVRNTSLHFHSKSTRTEINCWVHNFISVRINFTTTSPNVRDRVVVWAYPNNGGENHTSKGGWLIVVTGEIRGFLHLFCAVNWSISVAFRPHTLGLFLHLTLYYIWSYTPYLVLIKSVLQAMCESPSEFALDSISFHNRVDHLLDFNCQQLKTRIRAPKKAIWVWMYSRQPRLFHYMRFVFIYMKEYCSYPVSGLFYRNIFGKIILVLIVGLYTYFFTAKVRVLLHYLPLKIAVIFIGTVNFYVTVHAQFYNKGW